MLQEELRKKEEEIQTLRQALQVEQERTVQLRQSLQAKEKEKEEMSQVLRQENEKLREMLEKKAEGILVLDKEIKALQEKNVELSKSLIMKSDLASSLQAEVEKQVENVKTLTEEMKELRVKNVELAELTSQLQMENERLVDELKKFSLLQDDSEVDPVRNSPSSLLSYSVM